MEHPIEMDDFGVPFFLEPPICVLCPMQTSFNEVKECPFFDPMKKDIDFIKWCVCVDETVDANVTLGP